MCADHARVFPQNYFRSAKQRPLPNDQIYRTPISKIEYQTAEKNASDKSKGYDGAIMQKMRLTSKIENEGKITCSNEINNFIGVRKPRVKAVYYQWKIKIFTKDKKLEGEYTCPSQLNRILELEFRKNTEEFTTGVGVKTTYNLKDRTIRHSVESKSIYKLKRIVLVAGREIKLGQYWDPIQTHTCQLFPVTEEKNNKEFSAIVSTLKETLPDAKIISVQRIQNLLVYQKYYSEKPRITLASGEKNEKILFHGTRNISPGTIISCQEGFDPRLAGNQNLWGPAAYFAEDAKYVDSFAFRTLCDGEIAKQIIIASVTLGDCFDYGELCNPSLRQPPINIETKNRYDSVSGITKDTRVYAVFNSAQCCPRYIVKYTSS